jgi:hypothetical protein
MAEIGMSRRKRMRAMMSPVRSLPCVQWTRIPKFPTLVYARRAFRSQNSSGKIWEGEAQGLRTGTYLGDFRSTVIYGIIAKTNEAARLHLENSDLAFPQTRN